MVCAVEAYERFSFDSSVNAQPAKAEEISSDRYKLLPRLLTIHSNVLCGGKEHKGEEQGRESVHVRLVLPER